MARPKKPRCAHCRATTEQGATLWLPRRDHGVRLSQWADLLFCSDGCKIAYLRTALLEIAVGLGVYPGREVQA